MDKITSKTVKAVADRCDPSRPDEVRLTTVRLSISGLHEIEHEPGVFELADVELARVGDLSGLIDDLVRDGFDRSDVEIVVDKMITDLSNRNFARILAARIAKVEL